MAGFTSIGTGIGGFMSGYQQAQQNQMKIDALRNQLQQEQKAQQARALIANVLGQAPAAGFSGGIQPSPGLPGGNAPQPPMPGAASTPAPQPTAPQPSPYYPALSSPAPGQQPIRVNAQPEQPAGDPNALPTPQEEAKVQGDVDAAEAAGPPTTVQPTPDGGSTPAAVPASSPGDGGAGTTLQQPQPPTVPEQAVASANPGDFIVTDPKTGQAFNFSQMLHRDSMQDIVQRIKKARPDADDETVEMAAERLYTLGNQGDKMQQLGAMATLKYLGYQINNASHEQIAAARNATSTANVQTQVQGRAATTAATNRTREDIADKQIAAREATSKMIQDRIDARFNRSMQLRQMSIEQKAQAQKVANSYKNIMTQLAAVKGEISMGVPTTDQQAKLQALQQEAVKLYAQLKGQGLEVDSPAALLGGNEATVQPAK